MRIIIPMAGMGKRMRPHTLTTPKPLIQIAGKPIVHRLVEDLVAMCPEKVEEIAYVIGDFGEEVEESLLAIAQAAGAKGSIYYQDKPLGTGHAILCAEPALTGPVIVAFADTLFYADFQVDTAQDGIIWTKKIEDPSAFGVVETGEDGIVKRFWEKPKEWVSDEAIIGIYYFRDGGRLKQELQYLVDKDIKVKGEYQLTDALDNLKEKGARFRTAAVTHWLDCGNKDATVATNKTVLELSKAEGLVSPQARIESSVIVPPCYIAPGAVVRNSVIGPYVSIGQDSELSDCVVHNSIILTHSKLKNAVFDNAMIGNHAYYRGKASDASLGDYSEIK